MEYLLKSDEMKKCDIATTEQFKIPSICLMERAALSFTEELLSYITKNDKILIVAGSGNNGGDAVAIARMLFVKGYNLHILFCGNKEHATEQTNLQLEIAKQYNIPIQFDMHEIDFPSYNYIIDGIFGIGLNRDVSDKYAQLINVINKSNAKIFAIDIPSGINADNGKIMGTAIKADYTVTFGFKKCGHYLFPGSDFCGKVILKDVGITTHSLSYIFDDKNSFNKKEHIETLEDTMKPTGSKFEICNTLTTYTYDKSDLFELIPQRKNDTNKGSFGKITLFVGSENMAGAAFLAAKAAYKTGAGYVRIVTPKENRIILQSLIPEAVLYTYDTDSINENEIAQIVASSSVIACGCGFSVKPYAKELLTMVLKLKGDNIKLVLDADALNILSKNEYLYDYLGSNTIITPHLGEMSRLCNKSISEIKENLQTVAHEFAKKHSICCVLKDSRTFVCEKHSADYLNIRGCNGMSTAGSGDVLCGIISGLLALGMQVKTSADCGVLLHSLAGESAKNKYGNASMTASDIVDEISTVIKEKDR